MCSTVGEPMVPHEPPPSGTRPDRAEWPPGRRPACRRAEPTGSLMPGSRRRREVRMERVLGTPALFATAYGNVGSSIYYALGLTAVFALGLTPLVFVVAGIVFAATAATYAEGTVRFPEAGGSSSFARHGFNELVSFGAAWSQMLVYIVTIATSAFFVPHYLSIFWEPLRSNPWDIVGGSGRDRRARLAQCGRGHGGGEALDRPCRDRLRHAGAPRRARLRARLQPRGAGRQRPLGHRADVGEPRGRDPRGDARVHRGRDRLQPRRGGARARGERPQRVQARRGRGLRDLLHAAAHRALGTAGEDDRRGADDAPRAATRAGRLRERPDPRRRRQPGPRGRRAPGAPAVRRRAGGDDPLHRHERRDHRRLTHHVLDGDLPADARGLPAPAPASQDAVHRARALRGDRADRDPAAGGREVRRDALLARRDALVHGRARGDGASPDAARPCGHVSRAARTSACAASTGRSSRSSEGSRPGSRSS